MIIYPRNTWEKIWQVIIVITTTFIGMLMPIELILRDSPGLIYDRISQLSFVIFALDILFIIRYCLQEHPNEVFEENISIRRYLKTWFIIDLLAVIPFDLLFTGSILSLLRLLKMIKVGHIMSDTYQKEVRSPYLWLIGFSVYWIVLTSHWLSCGWLGLGGIPNEPDFFTRYLRALYWSVTTLTTVGYGDITPATNWQIIYTMLVQIMGVGVYGYIIGNVAGVFSKRDPARTQYVENIEKLTALVRYRQLPSSLQSRIRDYYLYLWKKRLGYDETLFLEGLPENLQRDVALYLKNDIIEKIPLFHGVRSKFMHEIAMQMEPLVLIPGDYICKEGKIGHQMFFVIQGTLSVWVGDPPEQISTMQSGDFFGEIALFMNTPRTATVRAESYCDLYTLDSSAFGKVMAQYPKIAKQIERKAKLRQGL